MSDAERERERDGQKIQEQTCWLTSTVCEAVEDVAFMTEALEAAGGVDAEVVAGAVERALVNVCVERRTSC